MNALLQKSSGSDLRSDGRAEEVADEVARNPWLLEQLLEGLSEHDDVIRARATRWAWSAAVVRLYETYRAGRHHQRRLCQFREEG